MTANWPTAKIIGYVRRMAARATRRGWHIQFYTPGTIVRDLLPFLADLEDRFVIDHMGYMLEADGLTEADFGRLLGVLAQGSCWVKLSGPYRITKDKPLSHVEPLGRALVSTRPDRLIWGSDWPHLPDGQRDTGELLNLLADWAPVPAGRHFWDGRALGVRSPEHAPPPSPVPQESHPVRPGQPGDRAVYAQTRAARKQAVARAVTKAVPAMVGAGHCIPPECWFPDSCQRTPVP